MRMYGKYSDADLNDGQKIPQIASVLTSSVFGAWLIRRDENIAKQFPTVSLTRVKEAREEIENLEVQIQSYHNDEPMISQSDVLKILDKLIESEGK